MSRIKATYITLDVKDGESILAIAYDTPIPGYETHNCNVLRLWKAIPTDVMNNRMIIKIGD